ncbi:UxaA family hydrolase [Paenibacillus sp. N1-5-1-14]|uniref:UxaA family hydrolase n=1 Tax=Paenibacillus radicibacter TaxID=2972488 RepID=UPI0021595378|nr:UxaA family hydrolase [Paenibacillus radicibacter]MCR8644027.1 UxaA family hydrolase [Paenibacillus radicibacter]
MAGKIETGADALVMDEQDHVATAIREMQAGERIQYRKGEELHEVTLVDAIPFGHKIALETIAKGTEVRKYGEVIGLSNLDIAQGAHVHVHNIEGIRGRGDQAKGDAQ